MIKTKCRICEHENFVNVVDYKTVNLSGNFFNYNKAKNDKKYSLKLIICKKCKHLQINNNLNPSLLFNHYVWKTSDSATNISLINNFLNDLVKMKLISKNTKALEIASNDGTLLKIMHNSFKNFCVGVEPAKNLKNEYTKKISVLTNFFSLKLSKKIKIKYNQFDLVIARNVIAHVKNPIDVFRGVNYILNSDGAFILEVPYLLYFFKENQYDNVFHEHNGFHSIKSINDLCISSNLFLNHISIIPSQGGSIRCYISKQNKNKSKLLLKYLSIEKRNKIYNLSSWLRFSNIVYKHKDKMYDLISEINNKGKSISVYGASGKGQVFLQFCNLDNKLIKKVYDKNKSKIGKFTPGTLIKIYDPKYILSDNPDFLLLTSWNIKEEIIKQEYKYIKSGGKIIVPFPNPKILKI
jgi:SAM-dependent methyltransferase